MVTMINRGLFNKKKILEYEKATLANLGDRKNLLPHILKNDILLVTNRVYFLGGLQIHGSFSPLFHSYSANFLHDRREENRLFYCLAPVSESTLIAQGEINIVNEFVDFIDSSDNIKGANITMPFKISVYKHMKNLAKLDYPAQIAGAVNTLYKNEDGEIRATNTDIEGVRGPIESCLERKGVAVEKINAYVFGTGGASMAAIAGLIQMGCRNINVLGRKQESLNELDKHFCKYLVEGTFINFDEYSVDEESSGELISRLLKGTSNNVIINTLPFGFKKELPESPISLGVLDKLLNDVLICFDAVYDASKGDTPLLKTVRKNENIGVITGLDMLLGQATSGFYKWTNGGKFQIEELKGILKKNKQ